MKLNVRKYKVAIRGGKWKYGFETLEDAKGFADYVFRKTGNVVAVESYWTKVSA